MRKVAVVLSVVILAAFGGRLSAHPGHEHKALGTVAVVDRSHIEIKTKDGKTVSVQLDAETKYMSGKTAAAVADVKVGYWASWKPQGTRSRTSITDRACGRDRWPSLRVPPLGAETDERNAIKTCLQSYDAALNSKSRIGRAGFSGQLEARVSPTNSPRIRNAHSLDGVFSTRIVPRKQVCVAIGFVF